MANPTEMATEMDTQPGCEVFKAIWFDATAGLAPHSGVTLRGKCDNLSFDVRRLILNIESSDEAASVSACLTYNRRELMFATLNTGRHELAITGENRVMAGEFLRLGILNRSPCQVSILARVEE